MKFNSGSCIYGLEYYIFAREIIGMKFSYISEYVY